jgi:hypothetical protein
MNKALLATWVTSILALISIVILHANLDFDANPAISWTRWLFLYLFFYVLHVVRMLSKQYRK